MFWAIVIGFIGFVILATGLTFWTGYEQPPKKGEEPKPPVLKTEEQRAGEKKFGAITTLVGVVIFAGLFAWYEFYYQSEEQAIDRRATDVAKACEDRIAAYVMSQNFVKRELKSPSSASFPSITQVSAVAVGGCKFDISAFVDAQNGFGAQIRTHYTAKMEYLPDTKMWRALNLNIIQ